MRITVVEYSRTYNLGDYESRRITLTAELETNDTVDAVYTYLRKKVSELHADDAP